jgi:hypothetical protein
MRGVTSPSAVGAGVVSTWVSRFGASSSHVSVRQTLYPTQQVVPFLARRASASWGELTNWAAGGMPSSAVRHRTPPALRR